jgi:predicted amidohydrolase
LALFIFYKICFNILYIILPKYGDYFINIPADLTNTTGMAHWHILNRSRAIENVSYVISPCATGEIPGGGESYGHSLIINPWGEIIKDAGKNRGIITASIDISLVHQYRKQLPSLKHDQKFIIKEF